MFSNCANPKCALPFDYHMGGEFFRFVHDHPDANTAEHTHGVVHFWLCRHCCQFYTLEYKDGRSLLQPRDTQEASARAGKMAGAVLHP